MSYQLSTENGGATMDVTKLQAAIQKQDEYLSSRGPVFWSEEVELA